MANVSSSVNLNFKFSNARTKLRVFDWLFQGAGFSKYLFSEYPRLAIEKEISTTYFLKLLPIQNCRCHSIDKNFSYLLECCVDFSRHCFIPAQRREAPPHPRRPHRTVVGDWGSILKGHQNKENFKNIEQTASIVYQRIRTQNLAFGMLVYTHFQT